jgi:hypothetical protein
MLCLVSPSSSPTPLPPPRRSRSHADRAAPPGIAVSCGDPGAGGFTTFAFFSSVLMVHSFAGWRQCAPECVVCPVQGSPVRGAEGRSFPRLEHVVTDKMEFGSSFGERKKTLEFVDWVSLSLWIWL